MSELIIENGVLTKYNGNDKNVVIPDSVTAIGKSAFDFCTNLTIYAPAGSYAENYARKEHIKFQAI